LTHPRRAPRSPVWPRLRARRFDRNRCKTGYAAIALAALTGQAAQAVMHRALSGLVAVAAAAIVIAYTGSRLGAPGPPEFYIEPNTRMMLVAIEPGSFVMGSPATEPGRHADEQLHRIAISHRIYMGRDEVSQTEWQVMMGTNPSYFSDCARCPVEQVNFYDVNDFLTRLTARSTAMRYRLPTEAEWEYACRAGTTTAYAFGNRLFVHDANVNRTPAETITPGVGGHRTQAIGSFPPNPWGLRDMHGSVWEWTNDVYGPYEAQPDVDPRGPENGTARVIRGGSWSFDAESARCAARHIHAPQDKGFGLGFRVVGEPVEERR
jgi:formylglycine-generating enzyme required for sulfatase activity